MTAQAPIKVELLFRQEVVDAKRGDWLGSIRLATPLSHRVLTLFALAAAIALIVFLICGHYTRRERMTGTLVPTAGLMEVVATTAGTVTQAMVEQGTMVHADDALVAISSEHASLAFRDTAAAVNEQLKLQRSRLDADLADQVKLEQDQNSGITTRIGMLHAQLLQVDGQIAIQRQQVASIRRMLEKIQPLLNKGYISALQVQQEESSVLDAQAQLKTLDRQRLDTEQQLSVEQGHLRQLPLTMAEQRHDLERKRAEIDLSLAENEAKRTSVLRAPKEGIVGSLFVKPGQSVSAGQTLLAIVPRNSPLLAQLLVPSRAIGFIAPGNTVVLRYQAYPFQKFGLSSGHVTAISRSAMTPLQIGALTGQQSQEAMYRVDVELEQQSIVAYGKQEALKVGMALDADILLDRRRLIEWAFEPLYGMERQIRSNH